MGINNVAQRYEKLVLATGLLTELVAHCDIEVLVTGRSIAVSFSFSFNRPKCSECPPSPNPDAIAARPGRGKIEGARPGAAEEGKVLEGECWMGK